MPGANSQLDRLRANRNRVVNISIKDILSTVERDLKRRHGAIAGLDIAWEEIVPPALAAGTRPVKLTPGGILTVKADDAAMRFELDRWLRSGGEESIKSRAKATVRRIRLV